jgi:hypothetical protein
MNKLILIGNVGRDPELRYTPSGQPAGVIKAFGISSFIEHRWAEAKEELKRIDSGFVNALSVYDILRNNGLWLPDNLPTPSRRLSKRWHKLLESTVELIRQIDRLNLTVSKMQTAPNRREALYYWDTWVQDSYSLCEKVERLIQRSCNVHRMAQSSERYFLKQVEVDVKHKICTVRQALVHGADNPQIGGRSPGLPTTRTSRCPRPPCTAFSGGPGW